MAISFTSWTAGTEDGDAFTLDWGTSADSLKGKLGYRYARALGEALNERIGFVSNPALYAPLAPITNLVRGQYLYDWAVQFDQKLNSASIDNSGGTYYGNWVDYTDNGGDWDGDTVVSLPKIDGLNEFITWLVSQGKLPSGTTLITLGKGKLIREWMYQRYLILDAMRWYGTNEGTFVSSKTRWNRFTSYIYSSWANAVTSFNASTPVSQTSYSFDTLHESQHSYSVSSGVEEWYISRQWQDVTLSDIPTSIAHQLVWYKWVTKETGSTFEDNDNSATENTLTKIYESSVAAVSSHNVIVGDTGNNTMSEPAKPSGVSPDVRNINSYKYARNGSSFLQLWKLNVTGGLKFVT